MTKTVAKTHGDNGKNRENQCSSSDRIGGALLDSRVATSSTDPAVTGGMQGGGSKSRGGGPGGDRGGGGGGRRGG